MTDFNVENHGSIFLLRPETQAARDWVNENIPADAQRLGDAIAVEHRFIGQIVDGIQSEGLTVE